MFIQHGRKPAYRRANQVFTINCGGQQTSDVPAQLLNAPFFSRVTNLYYDKQGSVSSDYVKRTRGNALTGDKPIKLLTYKNQLLCVGRKGVYRQDQIGRRPGSFKKIYSQLNVELEIFSIEKKENDMLFPCCAYNGHPQGNSGPELPNLKSGNVCLIAGYDTVAKAIVIKKYDLQNNKIISTATLKSDKNDFRNDSLIPYCQGLDLVYFKRDVGIPEGYYLFMLYKGNSENNTKGKIREFKLNENTDPVTIESRKDITPSQSMKDTLFIKAHGNRVYYFSWTNKEERPEKLSMDSVVWDDRIEGGVLQPEHIVIGRQNQGPVNTARDFNGKLLYDFKPWYLGNIVRNQYIGPSVVTPEGIPKLLVMWSPQTGYYILTNEVGSSQANNIVAHFHADRTPLEDEMIAEGSDIPKMSYSGSSFIYFKPDPNGDYFENSRGQLERDPISGGVEEPGKINRYSPAWFFPVLSAGQTETDVLPIDTPPQADNLIVPPVFTGIRRPLGIDLVQVCFGCLRPGAQEINGQMIMGGGTLNYYDGQKMVERGFAERPKIEIVKNPSPWMHDTTNYVDISNEIASVPDSEKTELQYTSEKKSSLYTEHDPTSPWQIAVPAEDGPAIPISGDSPDLKTAVGQDSSIGLGSLKFSSPASAGGAESVKDYRSITLNLSSYSKENLGNDILPKAIVINNKLYRFQQEVIKSNTVDLIAHTRDNPFAGFAEGAMISLYIPQCFQYKNNADINQTLTDSIETDSGNSIGKQVDIIDSVYQRFVQKGPGTSFRDLAPRLLNDIADGGNNSIARNINYIPAERANSVLWSIVLEEEAFNSREFDEALVGIAGGDQANIQRQIVSNGRSSRPWPEFTNNTLDEVNGDGGDFVGWMVNYKTGASEPKFYIVIDEGRAGSNFEDWFEKNNISRILFQPNGGNELTFTPGNVDTSPLVSFGPGNRYKVFEVSDILDISYDNAWAQRSGHIWKFYKGRTEIDTDEGNVIPRGTYYFQTYKNNYDKQKAPLVGTDVADNFDISDETNESSVRLRASTMIPLGVTTANHSDTDIPVITGGNRYEKSAQTPLAWVESERDKLINLLYIKTQTITSTLENLLKASIYKYVCRFKWVDSLGNEHRSQWSSPVQLITGPREGSKNRVIVGRLRKPRASNDPDRVAGYDPKTAPIDVHDNWDTVIVGEISTLARIGSEVLRIAPVELKCNLLNFSKKKNIAIEIYRTWDLQDTYRQVKLEPSQNDLKVGSASLRDGEILNGRYSTEHLFEDAVDGADQRDVSIRDTLRDNQLGQIIHPNNIVVNGAEEVEVFKERFIVYGFPAFRNKIFVSSPIDPTKNFGAQFSESNDPSVRYYEITFNEEVWKVKPQDDKLIVFTSKKVYYWGISDAGSIGPIEITNATGFRLKHKNDPIIEYPGGLLFMTDQNKAVTLYTGLKVKIHSEIDLDDIAPQFPKGWNRVIESVKAERTYEVACLLRSGHILFYNYRLDRWSVYDESFNGPVSGRTGARGSDAVSIAFHKDKPDSNAKLTYIDKDGQLYHLEQTKRDFGDGDELQWFSIETGEIQLGGITNYQNIKDVRLIGKFGWKDEDVVTPTHPEGARGQVLAEFWYNGEKDRVSPSQSVPPKRGMIYNKNQRVWRFLPTRKRCDSIRIRFSVRAREAEFSAIKLTAMVLQDATPRT